MELKVLLIASASISLLILLLAETKCCGAKNSRWLIASFIVGIVSLPTFATVLIGI